MVTGGDDAAIVAILGVILGGMAGMAGSLLPGCAGLMVVVFCGIPTLICLSALDLGGIVVCGGGSALAMLCGVSTGIGSIVCPLLLLISVSFCGVSAAACSIICGVVCPIQASLAGCVSLACVILPCCGSFLCAGSPRILFVLGCTPVGIILTMFTEPFWYPILRIFHAAVCPPETYLSIFESCSQLFCFGIPPSCGMNALDQGLILCTNLSPIHLINTMGNTSCSTGTGMVLNCCGFRWVEQIFTSTCGAFSSACAQLQSLDASDSSGSIQCLIPLEPAWQIHSSSLEPTASRVLREACQEFPAVQEAR